MRVGVITKKLGMSAVFNQSGARIPVTILKLDNCQVIAQKTKDKHGYTALQIGAFNFKNHKKASKPLQGYFSQHKITPKKQIKEFRISEDAMLEIGTEIKANHYVPNQFVDVTAVTVGKGFAGVMKRHNFSGLRASHGVSVSHRSHGSTGQCQDPGKVFKGKKMAGHMGCKQATLQNLQVISVDEDKNLLIIKGSVPGATNSYIIVNDAKKRALSAEAPYPCLKQSKEEPIDESKESEENIEVQASEDAVMKEDQQNVENSGKGEAQESEDKQKET
jgi:large subunit ribosomal protein L3